jgi:hypothetical protein
MVPRLTVEGFFVNGTNLAPYEISPHELIEKHLGFDWGPPLECAWFVLETDDGYRVTVGISVPTQRSGALTVTDWQATVKQADGSEIA